MTGHIHFVGGEKGGVGKSLTSRLLAQYFIDGHMPLIGFDSDSSHSTFSRFYGEFTAAVEVSDYESLDAILEAAEANPGQNIIVDLAAQTNTPLKEWLDDSDAFALLDELDYQAYIWHVMDDGADSMTLLAKLLKRLHGKANAQLVVVQNYGRGDDFSFFAESNLYQAALKAGARIITLNKLQSSLLRKVDFNNLSFWAAANNRDIMGIAERRRVTTWLRETYEQLERAIAPVETAITETPELTQAPSIAAEIVEEITAEALLPKKAETVSEHAATAIAVEENVAEADEHLLVEETRPTKVMPIHVGADSTDIIAAVDAAERILDELEELEELSDKELELIELMAADAVNSMPAQTS
ncbi:MAG: hypothetical protein ACPGPF_03540 [Pontibacterium sp.]